MPDTKYKIPNTRYKVMISRIGKFLLIFILVSAWIFSGWPAVWEEKYVSEYGPENISVPMRAKIAIANIANLVVTSCDVDNITDATCYNAISADGGTSYALAKGSHIDAPFQTLGSVQSVTSATLYYDSWGTLSGTWGIYLKDVRDGTTICSTDPAPENGSETRNSINCSSVTPAQLGSGVWLYVINNDDKGPESINLDYVYLYVDYTAVSNTAPTVSNVTFNGGNNITLVENSFKWATTSFLITDAQYCGTITSVTATAYRTATTTSGTTCSQNDNNCYPDASFNACTATTTGNTCGASDTTVEYDCGFKFWYIADPTANNSAYAGDIWAVAATATDSGSLSGTATNTAETIEINELLSLNVTSSINYGTLNPNTDTGATNSTTTVTNTGNADMDPQISGTDMSCSGNTLIVGQQKYSSAPFVYSSGGTQLTTSPTTLNLSLPKPTATTSAVTADVSWGIGIPAGQVACGPYTGTNTFTATTGI